LHVAKTWTGGFAVPVFIIFINTRLWNGGIQSIIRPWHHQTSART